MISYVHLKFIQMRFCELIFESMWWCWIDVGVHILVCICLFSSLQYCIVALFFSIHVSASSSIRIASLFACRIFYASLYVSFTLSLSQHSHFEDNLCVLFFPKTLFNAHHCHILQLKNIMGKFKILRKIVCSIKSAALHRLGIYWQYLHPIFLKRTMNTKFIRFFLVNHLRCSEENHNVHLFSRRRKNSIRIEIVVRVVHALCS